MRLVCTHVHTYIYFRFTLHMFCFIVHGIFHAAWMMFMSFMDFLRKHCINHSILKAKMYRLGLVSYMYNINECIVSRFYLYTIMKYKWIILLKIVKLSCAQNVYQTRSIDHHILGTTFWTSLGLLPYEIQLLLEITETWLSFLFFQSVFVCYFPVDY